MILGRYTTLGADLQASWTRLTKACSGELQVDRVMRQEIRKMKKMMKKKGEEKFQKEEGDGADVNDENDDYE